MRATRHGTVAMLHAADDVERDWLRQHIDTEPWQWFGYAVSCEPRDVASILDAHDTERADEVALREEAAIASRRARMREIRYDASRGVFRLYPGRGKP